jgi:ABC-type multidrug transport system fused ATPase/permease subunit
VLVMDDGRMAEYDAPQRLLAVPQGLFRALWEKHLESHGAE